MVQKTCLCAVLIVLVMTVGGCSHPSSSGTTAPNAGAQTPTSNTSQGQGGAWSNYEAYANYVAQHGNVIYQVSYQPNTVAFDEQTTERAFKTMSVDGTSYTLDASVPQAAELKPGSIMFLYGIAIRKVTAVSRQGSDILVSTTDADITDAIREGHIEWRVPIDYGALAPAQDSASDGLEDFLGSPALASGSGTSFSWGGNQNKCKYDVSFGWNDPMANMGIKMYCGFLDSLFVNLEATGTFHAPMMIGLLEIHGGVIQRLSAFFEDVSGHVTFNWTAYTKVPSGGNLAIALIDRQVKIKPLAWPVYLPIGGLPLELETSIAVLIHPAFTTKQAVAKGSYSFDFGGGVGQLATSSGPQPQGNASSTGAINQDTGVTSANAMGFVAAVEVPRFELSLAVLPSAFAQVAGGHDWGLISKHGLFYSVQDIYKSLAIPIKPYVYVNFVGSTGIFTNGAITSSLVYLPPCQRAQYALSINGGIGAKLNLSGLNRFVAAAQKMSGPKLEWAVSKPIYGPKDYTKYMNGIKCPGD